MKKYKLFSKETLWGVTAFALISGVTAYFYKRRKKTANTKVQEQDTNQINTNER